MAKTRRQRIAEGICFHNTSGLRGLIAVLGEFNENMAGKDKCGLSKLNWGFKNRLGHPQSLWDETDRVYSVTYCVKDCVIPVDQEIGPSSPLSSNRSVYIHG